MTKTHRDPRFHPERHRSDGGLSFDILPGSHVDEYSAPYLLGLVLVPALGYLTHRVWGGWYGVAFPMLILSGAALLSWWVAEDMRARKPLVKVRVHASIWAVCLSIPISTWVGPLTRPWLDVQVVATAVLCGTWTISTFRAVRGEGKDAHPRDLLAEGLGLAPSTSAELVEHDGPRRVFRLLHLDNTHAEVRGALDRIALKLRVPSVRLTPDPKDPAVSELVVLAEDVLAEPVPWPGPSAPGASVAVPARIGVRASGLPLEILRPGDPEVPRASGMVLVGGSPGAGKTYGTFGEVMEYATRPDVLLCWSDTQKWFASEPLIGPAIGWIAPDVESSRDMLLGLLRAVQVRGRIMAEHGFMEWVPEVYTKLGIPYIMANFEEISFISGILERELKNATAAVRSSGISIMASQQRPSAKNMSTDIRSLFGIHVMYGCDSDTDAAMVLRDDTIKAGAHPHRWGITKPGCVYIESSHEPSTVWSEEARTYRIGIDQLRNHIAEWAPRMARLDRWTEEAFGEPYRNRYRIGGSIPVAPPPATEEDEMHAAIRHALDGEDMPDEDRRVPLDYDRASTAGVTVGTPSGLTPVQRTAAFEALLGSLSGEITTDMIIDGMVAAGDSPGSRPSVHRRITEAVRSGRLIRLERGRYRTAGA